MAVPFNIFVSPLSFKGSLKNSHFFSSWHSATPHCNWVGVMCQLGRVTSLSLPSRYLKGNLSLSLTSLSFLTILNLEDNQFFGEIPGDVGRLLNLKTLRLGSNSFSGKIPSEFGVLTKLHTLDLSGNALAGEIPESIGNLTNLQFLDLSNNILSGSLPVEIGSAVILQRLVLSNNRLKGNISIELGDCVSLTTLDLGNIYKALGMPQEAIACYQHALQTRPNYGMAYGNLANEKEIKTATGSMSRPKVWCVCFFFSLISLFIIRN
ncbi:unnamed protein product [Vicia faba]|uniref:Uncharacterized protein n=1 Tax=Vicia faba TaxID=3906 RepID=A0AAV0ZUS7_VICFA|nr:unnamed protein product [Vicia faba]